MEKSYKFAVTATSAASDKRIIVSRHATLATAMKALKLAKGNPDYKIISLLGNPVYD
jgi:hypothetical protein